MKPTRTLAWEVESLAMALKIDAKSVREYFTDGRRVAFLIERRIAQEEGFKLASSEGAAFDLIDQRGGCWEARNITRGDVYFCPSYMVGSGRIFDRPGFQRKLAGVCGYILTDIESFPTVPYWAVPSNMVEKWWLAGSLGPSTKINRDKAINLLKSLPDVP